MKPVMQTVTGRGGNCMAACLASILELPITEVPNFFDLAPDEPGPWWSAVGDWLRPHGFGIITLAFEKAESWDELCLDGYHIVSGKSPRLGAHTTQPSGIAGARCMTHIQTRAACRRLKRSKCCIRSIRGACWRTTLACRALTNRRRELTWNLDTTPSHRLHL